MVTRKNSFTDEFGEHIGELAKPLETPGDLDELVDAIGDAKVVMLGEASHGTHEFYTWRAEISKRLIAEKGFSFMAVEGDWPACHAVNQYIKHYAGKKDQTTKILHEFNRWPTWMWANFEIASFMEWLRKYNASQEQESQVGFYGLDVYSLWESMDAVIQYLERVDPDAVATAKRAYQCFEPYGRDEQEYAKATALVPTSCEREVIDMLVELRNKAKQYTEEGKDAYFNAEQNALITKNAELYYRTMLFGDTESWNIRDRHMAETLNRLLQFYGPDTKAIVWAHNTHIGDARATDMASHGMMNIGEIARKAYGEEHVRLVGFGTYKGTVIAGREWGARMERMHVPPAIKDSWDDMLHTVIGENAYLIFSHSEKAWPHERIGQRAIGVVYHPEYELGNYVPSIIPIRYDAFVYIDMTQALHPIPVHPDDQEIAETYPVGY